MNRTPCFSALALAFVALVSAPAAAQEAAGGDAPPGNNGTIKIDGVVMDDGNENVPHPGCQFVVDFFGYDVGTRTATLELEGQAPTGGGMLLTDTFTFEVASRESGNELNHSRPVDLADELAAIEPHPQQGWHVKLTAHVDGAQGADVKHKVFWIEDCDVAPAAIAGTNTDASLVAEVAEVSETYPAPITGAVPTAEVLSAEAAAWNAAVWANAMRANAAGQPDVAVLSAGTTAGASAAAPSGTLPRTGAVVELLALVAIASLLVGGAMLAVRRGLAA